MKLPDIDPDMRLFTEPWRIMWVPVDNEPLARRIYDPKLTADFICLNASYEHGFEPVEWERAQQFEAAVAEQVAARLAGKLVTSAFFLVPPEGGEFDELYQSSTIIKQ